jgi:hypothetical protein
MLLEETKVNGLNEPEMYPYAVTASMAVDHVRPRMEYLNSIRRLRTRGWAERWVQLDVFADGMELWPRDSVNIMLPAFRRTVARHNLVVHSFSENGAVAQVGVGAETPTMASERALTVVPLTSRSGEACGVFVIFS